MKKEIIAIPYHCIDQIDTQIMFNEKFIDFDEINTKQNKIVLLTKTIRGDYTIFRLLQDNKIAIEIHYKNAFILRGVIKL